MFLRHLNSRIPAAFDHQRQLITNEDNKACFVIDYFKVKKSNFTYFQFATPRSFQVSCAS